MLYIKGATPEQQEAMDDIAILYPDSVFKECLPEWLNSEFSRSVIKDIDRLDVSDTTRDVESILLEDYHLTIDALATGTKNLILCKFYPGEFGEEGEWFYNRMGQMGENCFKWLMLAAQDRDIHVVTVGFRMFTEEDLSYGGVFFEDLQRKASSVSEFRRCMFALVDRGLIK